MWRNEVVLDFVAWLRARNEELEAEERAGFYGLDLYSLHASTAAVVRYLDETDPEAAARARERYACFDRFGDDARAYGRGGESCEAAVVEQLAELRERAAELAARDGRVARDRPVAPAPH